MTLQEALLREQMLLLLGGFMAAASSFVAARPYLKQGKHLPFDAGQCDMIAQAGNAFLAELSELIQYMAAPLEELDLELMRQKIGKLYLNADRITSVTGADHFSKLRHGNGLHTVH